MKSTFMNQRSSHEETQLPPPPATDIATNNNSNERGLPSNIIYASPDNGFEAFGDVTRGTPLDLLVHNNYFGISGESTTKSTKDVFNNLDFVGYSSKIPAVDSMLSWSGMSDGSVDTAKFSSGGSSYYSDVDDFAFLCPSMMVTDSSVLTSAEAITVPHLTMDLLMMSEREYDEKILKGGRQATFSEEFLNEYGSNPQSAPLLPKRQFFFEKGKTFSVKARLPEIIHSVESTLKSAGAIFSFDPKKIGWSVKCSKTQYTFTIRVFQIAPNDDTMHLIEFKRMSGCCIGFTKLYNQLHGILVSAGALATL